MFHPGYSAVDECGCDPEAAPARLTPCEECAQECAQECDSASCAVELTSQCTDQCVVVACNDAHHGGTSCEEILPGPACGKECFGEVDCAAFDELFRCCNEYHPEQPDYRPYSSDLNMAAAYAFISDPAFDSYFAGSSQTQTLPARDPVAFPPLDSSTSTPQLVPSPAFQPSPSPFGQREPSVSVPSPHLPELPSPVAQTQQAPLLQCKWAGCIATFSTLSDLVGHVNLQHLRLPSPLGAFPAPSPYMTPPGSDTSQQQGASQQQSPTENSVACLWGDCQLYPPSQSVPGPSSGSNYDVIDFLASHLLEDHLGLPARAAHHTPTPTPAPFGQGLFQAGPSPLGQAPPSRSPPPPTPVVSLPEGGPPTPVPEHDCSAPSAHVCKWTGCGKSFTSCDTLTEHIASAHIGSGRAHYDCYWEGCGRNGESGFASKQKISRHMQSHTGHRPFQCTVCNQNFSEAATLAQHMRRHTQEKPYACDFPGCGKAFAIAGALTIHKRIHNGSKPFKCSFCDRAFSESSNLSKHLRTHTGARPYPCTEPGCSKSFARPDQLARHMGVHKRKAAENAAKVAAAS
ncbi:hypothetical protein C8Q79DRAFT_918524 [Trametes meyenii]|nr:hypothetical protein C8Q79DRAFT_918524 [Trametes meyenii]